MSEHAFNVERAVRWPNGPQECSCGDWQPNLQRMKRHIAQPEAKVLPLPVAFWAALPVARTRYNNRRHAA